MATTPDTVSSPDATDALRLCGTGVVLYTDPATDVLQLVPTLCHRWACPHCRHYRRAKAFAQARAGLPERLLVLTVRPADQEPVFKTVNTIRVAWRRLVQRIRNTYGPFEWMAFLEFQKNGSPHLHVLTRGEYIPQKWLSDSWHSLTGAFKVHISKVDHVPAAINECVKYLLKTAAFVQAAAPGRPIYTMSRHWLPDSWSDEDNANPPDPYAIWWRIKLADAAEVARDLGSTVTLADGSNDHYVLSRPDSRDPPAFDPDAYGWDDMREALRAFLVWKWWPNHSDGDSLRDELLAYWGVTCPAWTEERRIAHDCALRQKSVEPLPQIDADLNLAATCYQTPLPLSL